MQSPLPSSLVIDKIHLVINDHDISRLEIPEHETIRPGHDQFRRQPIKIILQPILVDLHSRQFQKTIFKIVQIPPDTAFIKNRTRQTSRIIQSLSSLQLEFQQLGQGFPIQFHGMLAQEFTLSLPLHDIQQHIRPQIIL